MLFCPTAANRLCWRSTPSLELQKLVCCPRLLRLPVSATSIFAPALLHSLAPEQKGARDEFWPKKLPIAQSTSVQYPPAASAAFARCEDPFPQSDAASRS